MSALNLAFSVFFVLVAAVLVGLILTKRIDFPLMLDTGMALMAVGAVLMAEAMASEADGRRMAWRAIVMLFGGLLIYASTRREKKKRARSEPHDLTNEAMQRVHGGKK